MPPNYQELMLPGCKPWRTEFHEHRSNFTASPAAEASPLSFEATASYAVKQLGSGFFDDEAASAAAGG